MNQVAYRTTDIGGVPVFYREAGPADAPTLLLRHGFPSSSRMYEPLLSRLADTFHLVAPDFPGFGDSGAPAPAEFAYTFDHLAEVIAAFTDTLGLSRYSLFVQDYGGPVGFRLARARPERLQTLIVQNAVSKNFLSLAATRQRHVGTNPEPWTVDPDLWTDEYAHLSQPGQAQLQLDLFYDYRTNVASYPAWSAWLREHQPPLLVLWGRYDPSFQQAEVAAYRRDVPSAETHLLDAGHFALYGQPEQAATLTRDFLTRHLPMPAGH